MMHAMRDTNTNSVDKSFNWLTFAVRPSMTGTLSGVIISSFQKDVNADERHESEKSTGLDMPSTCRLTGSSVAIDDSATLATSQHSNSDISHINQIISFKALNRE